MEYTSRMGIEDPCLEGRWPGSCPASSRRGSGPSSAIDAQVPKSEKDDNCRTRCKQNVWNTSAVRWRARGSAIVLSLFVTLIRSRRDPNGASLDTRTLPSEKVKHLGLFFKIPSFWRKKPGHSHVRRAEVWRGLVDPLGNLPQDVPLPVVGRALHLRRKIIFSNLLLTATLFYTAD